MTFFKSFFSTLVAICCIVVAAFTGAISLATLWVSTRMSSIAQKLLF